MGDDQQATEEATRLAKIWAGRRFSIRGRVGGSICVNQDDGKVSTATEGTASRFVIEQGPLPNTIAFRVVGTQKYLTNIMYGDRHRQSTAEVLAAAKFLLPDHIPTIIDYAIGRPTDETNFEGPGYNYSPMNAQDGPPTKLQLFELESVSGPCLEPTGGLSGGNTQFLKVLIFWVMKCGISTHRPQQAQQCIVRRVICKSNNSKLPQ